MATSKNLREMLGEMLTNKLHPDELMEAVVESADGPLERAPAKPEWTVLDRAPGGVMVLVGLSDGRTAVCCSGSGPWSSDDFSKASPPPKTPGFALKMHSHVYRHSYESARRVEVYFDDDRKTWYAENARTVEPKEAGRATPVINQEAYEQALGEVARQTLDAAVAGEDPEIRIERFRKVLVMVAKHSFQRGWKELGFGWFS